MVAFTDVKVHRASTYASHFSSLKNLPPLLLNSTKKILLMTARKVSNGINACSDTLVEDT